MEVHVEKVGPCRAKVRFTVPPDEFEGEVEKALRQVGRRLRMKGFRPGKIPTHVVEKSHGAEIRAEARVHFREQAFRRAVQEEELSPIGYTRPDLSQVEHARGAEFASEFEISLRPEFDLGEYTGLEVESELEPVLDAEVESAIQNLKLQHSRPEPAGAEGLPADGMGLCKVTWLHGDEEILARDGLRLSPDTPVPGVDPEAFAEALTGAQDGDTVELELTIPPDFERPELRGQKGVCRVTVEQAFKMIEPTEAEIQAMVGAETPEGVPDTVRERIREAKERRERARVEEAVIERLVEAHPMELPETMVEQQTEARLQQVRSQLAQEGMPEEAIEKHLDEQRPAAEKQAARGLQALFILEKIAAAEGLKVTDEDLRDELEAIAKRNEASLEEVADYYRKHQLVDQVAIEILERKVRAFLYENTQIQEPR